MTAPKQKGLAADLVHVDDAEGDHVVLVPLDRIEGVPAKDKLRMSKDQFEQLCTSIREDGLHQPVTLRAVADKKYKLVAGRHRAAAHAKLGFDVVPAVIRADLDDAGEAVATAVENLARADLRPYEEAEAYQAILDVEGMTQTKLAKRVGVSQSHVSKRLKLLQVPKQIALVAGADALKLEDLLWFAPLDEWPVLIYPVAKELEKTLRMDTIRLGHWFKTTVIKKALCDSKAAWAPFDDLEDVASIEKAGYSARWWVRDNTTFRKDVYALERVLRFGPEKSPDLVIVLDEDVKKAKHAAERALQRWRAQQAKEPAESGPAVHHGSGMTAAAKREQRIQNKARKLQLEAMVAHVKKQDAFDEELVQFAYREFLKSVGQVASRKVEQEALADILGEYAPPERKTSWGSVERPLSRGCPELVDQLWEKDRVVLDRYVAAVVHLHAGGYDHDVRDAKVHKFTTGKTPAAIKKAAAAAVDGPKKPPAKAKAKKPARKKAGSKAAVKKGSKAAKQIHELHANDKVPEASGEPEVLRKMRETALEQIKRPSAAAGKECPDCKAVVEKKGRGKDARLTCFCTPEDGVPVEVKG